MWHERKAGPSALTQGDLAEVRAFSSRKCAQKVHNAATALEILAGLAEQTDLKPEVFAECAKAILKDY